MDENIFKKNFNNRIIITKGNFYYYSKGDIQYEKLLLALETTCNLTKETAKFVIIQNKWNRDKVGDIEEFYYTYLTEYEDNNKENN